MSQTFFHWILCGCMLVVSSTASAAPIQDAAETKTESAGDREARWKQILDADPPLERAIAGAIAAGPTGDREEFLDATVAVEYALQWLTKKLGEDGAYWEGETRRVTSVGLTAAALVVYHRLGYLHRDGKYQSPVTAALAWLGGQQKPDGAFGDPKDPHRFLRDHCVATIAILEALQRNDHLEILRDSATRAMAALDVYLAAELNPADPIDAGSLAWAALAAESARSLEIESKTSSLLHAHLAKTSPRGPEQVTIALRLLTTPVDERASTPDDATRDALTTPPLWNAAKLDTEAWYFGTLAARQFRPEPWQTWRPSTLDELLKWRFERGRDRGSWKIGRVTPEERCYMTAILAMTTAMNRPVLVTQAVSAPPENR